MTDKQIYGNYREIYNAMMPKGLFLGDALAWSNNNNNNNNNNNTTICKAL